MTENLQLRHHRADEAKGILDQLVDLYLEVYAGGGEFYNEDRYRRQLDLHMQRTGWKLVTATAGRALVGYIYGFPLPPETRWWEGIRQPAPPGFTDEDGTRTFALSELMVTSAWQRRGVATALHTEIIQDRSEGRATLLVTRDNVAAQAAYHSWGWRKVTELRPSWDNAPILEVLIRSPIH